jgi:Cdc6-like AAA superfamily ATPase
MDATTINRCFMRFQDRAERITAKQVAETFVSVGPLLDLLDSPNNQVIYGRRGTGKTHALRYFQNLRNQAGDIAIYIDGQNIGSNGSIYNDVSLPVSERATRLLVDVCSAIHHELLEIFTHPDKGWDLSSAVSVLDKFVDGFSETRVRADGARIGSRSQRDGQLPHGRKL